MEKRGNLDVSITDTALGSSEIMDTETTSTTAQSDLEMVDIAEKALAEFLCDPLTIYELVNCGVVNEDMAYSFSTIIQNLILARSYHYRDLVEGGNVEGDSEILAITYGLVYYKVFKAMKERLKNDQ